MRQSKKSALLHCSYLNPIHGKRCLTTEFSTLKIVSPFSLARLALDIGEFETTADQTTNCRNACSPQNRM